LTRHADPELTSTSGVARRRTIGEAFSPRSNSLNFLRLAFCLTVIFSHAITLGGFGNEWILGNRTTIAVPTLYGFFCLSGFLIAGSAQKNRVGRYLWQRFLRIMPGYWACLLVTAFLIGAIGWIEQAHPASCSIFSCYYFIGHNSPFDYVYHNFLLGWNQFNIGSTPYGGPVPYFWNNSVWTLLPEVCCYLFLAGLAALRLLDRRRIVAGLACGVWLIAAVIAWWGPSNSVYHAFGPFVLPPYLLFGVITLGPAFMAGAVIYLYRDKIPDSGWLALGFVVVFAAGSWLPYFGDGEIRFSHYLPGPTSVMAPALAYPLLWLGIHLPSLFQRVGARNDYSYGVYIYGWPVSQLLGMWGVQHRGYVVFTASAVAGSAALAVLSWHLVEKRALSLKKLDPRVMLAFRTRRLTAPGAVVARSEAEQDPVSGVGGLGGA
jgi:peptidoglycan/LPS O-acetylase OafA/YrhL